jgi:hypothetical protein
LIPNPVAPKINNGGKRHWYQQVHNRSNIR